MFKEMTTKKKIIIAVIVIAVIALIIFLVVRRNKKKKKDAELLNEPLVSNYQQTEAPTSTPRMRVVPKEDQQEARTEAPLSVQEVIPEKKPAPAGSPGTGAPGTLGVPVKKQSPQAPAAPKSSLPPEFMTNANDPNAG